MFRHTFLDPTHRVSDSVVGREGRLSLGISDMLVAPTLAQCPLLPAPGGAKRKTHLPIGWREAGGGGRGVGDLPLMASRSGCVSGLIPCVFFCPISNSLGVGAEASASWDWLGQAL